MKNERLGIFLGLILVVVVLLSAPTRPVLMSLQNGAGLLAGRNVNMVSGQKLPWGDPFLQRQNEPSIAVSTRNPMHLLAGANDYRTVDMLIPYEDLPGPPVGSAAARDAWLGVYKSFDGGQSWQSGLLYGFPQDYTGTGLASPLKAYGTAADPVVRAGTNGLFYMSGIAFNRNAQGGGLFIARFIDNNNKEKGDTIKYLGAAVLDKCTPGQFIDKPWLAVDLPRSSSTVTIDGQAIPAHNVYVAYTVFLGNTDVNVRSKVLLIRSTNCGLSWGQAVKLSESQHINQGVAIGVDPRNAGILYIAWRRFAHGADPDAILVCRSVDGGQTFSKPVPIATLTSFDQGSTAISFRTNSYPSLAIDQNGLVYAAWSQRPAGDMVGKAKVFVSASGDGISWSPPTPIDSNAPGHQVMPSLTYAMGRVVCVWYDQRHDLSGNFTQWIDDLPGQVRHTLDVRAAEISTETLSLARPTIQVSRYLWTIPAHSDTPVQAQYSRPNYPLFKEGTRAFYGDYIDVTPAPMFIPGANGGWVYNMNASQTPVFHAAWTDNRDVRPPADGDWSHYTPPSSTQDEPFKSGVGCEVGQTSLRNQNVYTASLTGGLVVGSPGNNKPLGPNPYGEAIKHTFVVYVKNLTASVRSFRLTIQAPQGVSASFFQYGNEERTLDVTVAPASSIARTVFASSTSDDALIQVLVKEISAPGGGEVPGGLNGSVILNPDIENPDIENPDIENPDIENPDIENYEVHNPDIENPDIENPDIENTQIINPDIENPDIENNDIVNPDIENPDIENPDIENLNVMNPDIENPDIENPDIENGALSDYTWRVKNIGNTASSYRFRMIASGFEASNYPGFGFQLLIYRVYTSPVAANCVLKQTHHDELLANIVGPDIINPDIENPDIENPDIENPDIENATFWLAPGDEAYITLRVYDPDDRDNIKFNPAVTPVAGVATAQSVNSQDELAGRTVPPIASPYPSLTIYNTSLPAGTINTFYSADLIALGGTPSYTWSYSGTLPPGISFNGAAGVLSGTPTAGGTFNLTFTVVDYKGQSASKSLPITIATAGLDHFSFGVISGPITAGQNIGLTITAKDSANQTLTSYSGTNTLSDTTGTISPVTTGAFTNGVWTGTAVITKAQTGITIITTGEGKTGTSNSFAVAHSVIHHLTISSVGNQNIGVPFSITVTAKDNYENTVADFTGSCILEVLPAGQINPTHTDNLVNGTWTGPVIMETAGTGLRIKTHYGTTPPYYFEAITNTFDVGGGILFIVQPSTTPALQPITPAPKIKVVSGDNSPLPGVTVTMAIGTNPGGGILSGGTSQITGGDGTAAFPGLSINNPGNGYTLRASTNGFSALSNPFNITAVAFSISGTVTLSGMGLSGVVMSGLPGNPTTNSSGYYEAAVSTGWSGTVTPTLTGYTFTPANRTYTNVTSNQTGQDYTAAQVSNPEINIRQNTTPIPDSGTHDFGTHAAGSNTDVVLTIENLGTSDLTITTPITIGGTNSDQFSVLAQPVSPVAASQSTTFTIRFSPTSAGAKSAAIAISNNDADENPYNITLVGNGTDAGSFVSTGSMATARGAHTATILSWGKVLVCGGVDLTGYHPLNAELYDYATGSFAAAGSLNRGRDLHTATDLGYLSNYKILICGGWGDSGYVGEAEIYDYNTGAFTLAAGPMVTARWKHTATLLLNGNVLICGGTGNSGPLANAELFNRADRTFAATGNMTGPRVGHTATPLSNGKVLICGGTDAGNWLNSAELYDPASGTFTPTGSMTAPRSRHAATLLNDGKVLICGGSNLSGYLSSAELYDPSAGTFSPVGTMATAGESRTAILLYGGKVLVFGGLNGGSISAAELFDPSAGTFVATGSMVSARNNHAAALLNNGRVLVCAGLQGTTLLSSAELYNPSGDIFKSTGSMATARREHASTLLANGKVLISGGYGGGSLSSAELYNPGMGTFTSTGSMATARISHTAVLLPNGKVLICGGTDGIAYFNTSELYDPSSGIFSGTGSMTTARGSHTAILLSNGKVLVCGGRISSGGGALNTAELYDPSTGTFTATGSMTTGHVSHTATRLSNGKVLVCGGWSSTGALNTAELYDPSTGTFTATGNMATGRQSHAAALLQNGKVLVCGGYGSGGMYGDLKSAEVYDPGTGTFSAVGDMPWWRSDFIAVLLPNGKVLVCGGEDFLNGSMNTAELYDPVDNIFRTTARMLAKRYYHTAVLLQNGQVLVCGGEGPGVTQSSAELYLPQ